MNEPPQVPPTDGPGDPVTEEEVTRRSDELIAGIDALHAAGTITIKDRNRRRVIARKAFKRSMLCRCAKCAIVSSDVYCPACGVMIDPNDLAQACNWRGEGRAPYWRKMVEDLTTDLLRTDGHPPRACLDPVPRMPSPFIDKIVADFVRKRAEEEAYAHEGEPPPKARSSKKPSATERGEKMGIKLVD